MKISLILCIGLVVAASAYVTQEKGNSQVSYISRGEAIRVCDTKCKSSFKPVIDHKDCTKISSKNESNFALLFKNNQSYTILTFAVSCLVLVSNSQYLSLRPTTFATGAPFFG